MEAPKKGPGLGLLIGVKPEPKGATPEAEGPPVEMEPSSGNPEAEDMAVDGMMDALETKDSASFKSALMTFLDAAGYKK